MWLAVVLLKKFVFTLDKGGYRYALNLRYRRPLKGLPAMFPCGEKYIVTHALNCRKGGFFIMRHNILMDFEANMFFKIVNDVEEEP